MKTLSSRVKDKQLNEIYNFLQNEGILGRPIVSGMKVGVRVLEESKSSNFVLIIPITKFDPVSNEGWLKSIYSNKSVAYFLPGIKSIVINDIDNYSSLGRSIILAHEGFHAKSIIIDKVDINNSHYENEIDAYNLQTKIVRTLGGNKYRELLKKEEVRITKETKITKNSIDNIPDFSDYSSEFKVIFGNSLTSKDVELLNTTIWLNAFFNFVEKNFLKEERNKIKADFIIMNENMNK